jgi:hypothetical protein
VLLALLAGGGVAINVELGSGGNVAVPLALMVPAAGGFGAVGYIVGRYSTKPPPGAPLRPAPPPRPAITRATVTAATSQLAVPSDLVFARPDVLGHGRPEVTS